MNVSKRNEVIRERVAMELGLLEKGFLNYTASKFVKDIETEFGTYTVRIDLVVPKEESTAQDYNEEYLMKKADKERIAKEKEDKKAKAIAKKEAIKAAKEKVTAIAKEVAKEIAEVTEEIEEN